MEEHPIEKLMSTVMTNLKDMVDVNTIIGSPIVVENMTIVPVSKVTFGFAVGGSEFNSETLDEYARTEQDEEILYKLPFGGGSGAGVNIKPIAFLVIGQNAQTQLIRLDNDTVGDRVINSIPELITKLSDILNDINMKKKSNCDCTEV